MSGFFTPNELLDYERRSMGRDAVLVDSFVRPDELTLIVYECDTVVSDEQVMWSRRWAIQTVEDGQASRSGGIIATQFRRRRG